VKWIAVIAVAACNALLVRLNLTGDRIGSLCATAGRQHVVGVVSHYTSLLRITR